MQLQTMVGMGRFVDFFRQRLDKWQAQLGNVEQVLKLLLNAQKSWASLEAIFLASADIRAQLPDDTKRFETIDGEFKELVKDVAMRPLVVECCATDGREASLLAMNRELEKCQKALNEYLDMKKNIFPRFYFVSNMALLDILSNGNNPTRIMPHLGSVYDGIGALTFVDEGGNSAAAAPAASADGEDGADAATAASAEVVTKDKNPDLASAMVAKDGETVKLFSHFHMTGAVETWLNELTKCMQETLCSYLDMALKEAANWDVDRPREEWVASYAAQLALLACQIVWTEETEGALEELENGADDSLKKALEVCNTRLEGLIKEVQGQLTKELRNKIITIITIDVHNRDIVQSLISKKVEGASDFAWQSQLRFIWDDSKNEVLIRITDYRSIYSFEYVGNCGRLVITPLTDRCYVTLTTALRLMLGGAPAGPAGTGKTETTKDLARGLGVPCYVFNCSDQMNFQTMADIFKGLSQVGAWGCFDEFNRIPIEVLSVVATQVKTVLDAVTHLSVPSNREEKYAMLPSGTPPCKVGYFDFSGDSIALVPTCGFFITMNPGYAGRTELPDNLKALFRPVTMIVPDLQMICEIMLFSEGFEMAKVLAKKMTTLYKLSKEQLSKQFHYDFGLRSLKSVLVMAGGLKREYADMAEDIVLMRVLRDSNMPKYVFEDVPLFLGLINDLFPGLDCPRVGYEDLKKEVAADMAANGYKCSEEGVFNEQVNKVLQMYETQIVRHTTMIVGPTGGGKTLVLDTLRNARLKAEDIVVRYWVINPKAQPLNELYGLMDPVTRDWTDGILSNIFRELNQPLPKGKENEMRWIIYDGDVDAVWVENMNSVMDDNRLLTLPNGERIKLQPHCAMICETFDLQYASPATISRCGMVWVDPKNLGYRMYFERWVRQRCGDTLTVAPEREDEALILQDLFDQYVKKLIDFVLYGLVDGVMGAKLRGVVPINDLSMVRQLCVTLDSFLEPFCGNPDFPPEKTDIENIFCFACTWSIGATLVGPSRAKFDVYLKKITQESLPESQVYDNVYDPDTKRWVNWSDRVPTYTEPSPFAFYKIIVPTKDSMLYTHLLEKLAAAKPMLLVGESGTAKTLNVQDYLASLDTEKNSTLTMGFSSRTTSMDVQVNIEANVDKRAGNVYGPPVGKKLVIFIDDMNMPKVDLYGTQQPITLLLTLMSRGFIYDRAKDLNQKLLKDLSQIGAMGPPGGGRNPVDPRFVALFNVYNLPPPTDEVLTRIYDCILGERYQGFPAPIKDLAPKFTTATLSLFKFILENLPPTPAKFHYIFNLRDLSRVYEGMCLATEDEFTTSEQVVRLYRNECLRIFCDRLTSDADLALVGGKINEIIGANFSGSDAAAAAADPMLFGDYANCIARLEEEKEDARLYKDMGGYDPSRKIFMTVMELYNVEHKPMSLVLFQQALEHLTRIHRIIRMKRGNAMLIGVGGSGKQSLTRLAAFCAGYSVFTISLLRNYGETEFREDLKELYKQLGTQEVVFLFTDAHVADEGFLEFINNMLTTGMVPALYEPDEKDGLINSVRKEAKEHGIVETPDSLWAYYVTKCRNNMHIVLAMSPSGDKLRIRCRNFPGLISASVIDWFFPWPEDALQKVAEFFLADVQLPAEHRDALVNHLVFAHLKVVDFADQFAVQLRRYYYVTPKNYLDFISNYSDQLAANYIKVDSSVKRLDGGLTKLIEAASAVDRMQVELTEKKVIVDAKTKDVEALIEDIKGKTEIADAQQVSAGKAQVAAQEMAVKVSAEKEKADAALMEALPAVEAAAAALENIKKDDLGELKAMKKPPALVMSVCLQVTNLRPTGDKYEETWGDAQKMLGNPRLLDLLKNYAKDKITEKMIKGVKKYFRDPALTVDNMASVSKAGQGLLVWVVAITKYYEVARNVEPLKASVREMEKTQMKTEKELAELQEQLAELAAQLAELNANYKIAADDLSGLQETAQLMEKRLAAASKLITGLTGERTRWTADVGNLGEQKVRLIGDCVLSASFLSYSGAFTRDFRSEMIYKSMVGDLLERKVPLTTPFKLETLLTTDATVQGWSAKGLPGDEHSVQNGILTTKASRFPLCIDPQQQAVGWIKNTYGKELKIKTLAESDFMKHLELAVQARVWCHFRPFPRRRRVLLLWFHLRVRASRAFRRPPSSPRGCTHARRGRGVAFSHSGEPVYVNLAVKRTTN